MLILPAQAETCIASIHTGNSSTASGMKWHNSEMVAAHKTIAFGHKVRITNFWTNEHAIVRIIDRGPFVKGRCVDVTPVVAKEIGCSGLCKVIVDD